MKSKKFNTPADTTGFSDLFNSNNDSDGEASEQSLLSLIEERRTDVARSFLGISPDLDESSLGDGFDDIDETDRPGLDQLMMRLGGNGF